MEYYNNIGMDKKIALYFGGVLKKTDYIYDVGKTSGNITVMQRSDIIDVFDNITGKKLFQEDNVKSFRIEDTVIIFSNGLFSGARMYDGTVILDRLYLDIHKKGEFYIVTEENSNMGVYKWQNNELKEIIKPQDFTDIRVYENGITVYKLSNHSVKGYYSLDGKMIVEPKYNELNFNSKGINVSTVDDKKGFFSYSGKQIIPPIYSDIKSYNNCFIVKSCKKTTRKRTFGLYNNQGKLIVEARYDSFKIESPYIVFELGGLSCVYDLITGKRILPLKYKAIEVYYNVIYATEDLKTFSLYSGKSGKKLLDDNFDTIKIYSPYILSVSKNGHLYYYLTPYNILVDSEKYDVEYSTTYKEVQIGKKGKNKKTLFSEWINSQK